MPQRLPILLLTCLPSLMLPGCSSRVDLETSRKFQQAQAAFDQAEKPEDYMTAAALYQEILDSGMVSGAVLYNQGNAWMGAGQRGRAIAAYRQAKRYLPRDPYLDANLRSALGTAQAADPKRPLIETVFFWQNRLSYGEKFYLLGLAALATFALATTALFVRRRRLFFRLATAGLAVTLLLLASAAYDWHRFDGVEHGVTVVADVVARKGNAASFEPAFVEPLTEGTEFRVLEHRDRWLLIQLPGGQEGWIEANSAALY